MMYLTILAEDIAVEDYLAVRLEEFLKAFPEDRQTSVFNSFVDAYTNNVHPFFAPAGQMHNAEDTIACARENSQLFHLMPRETILEEELCVLCLDRLDPEGLPVYLRQKTNFAEVFIEIPQKVIKGKEVVTSSPGEEVEPFSLDSVVVDKMAIPEPVTSVAVFLAKSLISAGGSYVWDVVKKEVLKQSSLPDYYQEVYEETTRIIGSAFVESYIKEVRDLTQKLDMTLSHYNNMGRSIHDFNIVKDTSFDLIVKSDSLGTPGAFHYAEATVLHMMTLKEEYKRLTEQESSAEKLERAKRNIGRTARTFARNLRIKRDDLTDGRVAKISDVYYNLVPTWTSEAGRKFFDYTEGSYVRNGYYRRLLGPAAAGNMFKDDQNGFHMKIVFDYWDEIIDRGRSWKQVDAWRKGYSKALDRHTYLQSASIGDTASYLDILAGNPV